MSDPRTRWGQEHRADASDYDARWDRMAARGIDPHGEVAFVMAYEPASVLDAGCGTGRVAIELARRGVDVAGVDLDDRLLDAARAKAPHVPWHLADLATVHLGRTFDVVVLAGNVMIFVAPETEAAVLANLRAHLAPAGRIVAGFQVQTHRLPLATFDGHAEQSGLAVTERFATWERAPYTGGDYAVSVLSSVSDIGSAHAR
jgi:2-polyprenyl-3-methyl-5-hydroxy-6-metoxy-1,4-benzoquinol methylase